MLYPKRSAKHIVRFVVLLLHMQRPAEITQKQPSGRVILTQNVVADIECAAKKALGFVVLIAHRGHRCLVVKSLTDNLCASLTKRFGHRNRLVKDLKSRKIDARCFSGEEAILKHLKKSCEPGDVVIFLSNGSFGGIQGKLLERLT